jgi:hypothetical protein
MTDLATKAIIAYAIIAAMIALYFIGRRYHSAMKENVEFKMQQRRQRINDQRYREVEKIKW